MTKTKISIVVLFAICVLLVSFVGYSFASQTVSVSIPTTGTIVATPSPSPSPTPTPTPTPAPTPNPSLSFLHVTGGNILDASNNIIYLRGAAFGGLGESGLTYWNGGHTNLVTQFNAYMSLATNIPTIIRV